MVEPCPLVKEDRWRCSSPDQPAMYWACSLALSLLSDATFAPNWFAGDAPGRAEWLLQHVTNKTQQDQKQMAVFGCFTPLCEPDKSSFVQRSCLYLCRDWFYLCWSLVPVQARVCGFSTSSPSTNHSDSPPDQSPACLQTQQTRSYKSDKKGKTTRESIFMTWMFSCLLHTFLSFSVFKNHINVSTHSAHLRFNSWCQLNVLFSIIKFKRSYQWTS